MSLYKKNVALYKCLWCIGTQVWAPLLLLLKGKVNFFLTLQFSSSLLPALPVLAVWGVCSYMPQRFRSHTFQRQRPAVSGFSWYWICVEGTPDDFCFQTSLYLEQTSKLCLSDTKLMLRDIKKQSRDGGCLCACHCDLPFSYMKLAFIHRFCVHSWLHLNLHGFSVCSFSCNRLFYCQASIMPL